MGPWSGWALLRIVCVGRPPTRWSLWPRFPRGTPPLKGVLSAERMHTEGCPRTTTAQNVLALGIGPLRTGRCWTLDRGQDGHCSGLFALADRRHAGEPGLASHAARLLGSVLLVQKGSTPRAAQGAWWEDDDCTECVGIRHWTAQDWALLDIGRWSGWALLKIVCVGRWPTCRRHWGWWVSRFA